MLGSHVEDVCCGYKGHVAVGLDGHCSGLVIQDWDMPTLAATSNCLAKKKTMRVATGRQKTSLTFDSMAQTIFFGKLFAVLSTKTDES